MRNYNRKSDRVFITQRLTTKERVMDNLDLILMIVFLVASVGAFMP